MERETQQKADTATAQKSSMNDHLTHPGSWRVHVCHFCPEVQCRFIPHGVVQHNLLLVETTCQTETNQAQRSHHITNGTALW